MENIDNLLESFFNASLSLAFETIEQKTGKTLGEAEIKELMKCPKFQQLVKDYGIMFAEDYNKRCKNS